MRVSWLPIAVCVALAVGLVIGWVVTFEQEPTRHSRTFGGASVSVRVLMVSWSFVGCRVANSTAPGGAFLPGSMFTEKLNIRNLSPTSSCTLSSASASPAPAVLESDGLPVTLGPMQYHELAMNLEIDELTGAIPLNITLTGGP